MLSTRDNVIVIADEAHRSQYAELARNVRVGLPCSARIGFTGTPLLEGDETTVDVFGDYVSKYRFFQAVEDGATVPLYYESRVTEMHYDRETLELAIGALEAEEGLSDAQRDALSERFGTMAEVVTRTSRLVRIANDLVEHFLSVDESLKAMVVGLDKPTVVRLFHYFKLAWAEQLAKLRDTLVAMQPWDSSRPYVEASIARMERLDSAVVLSRSQADVEYIQRRCPIDQEPLDAAWIENTLARSQTEDLAERFKTPTDPLRLVFVCSMWITGFDAPSVGVVYLDRPMRNHSLMQTIARANRVHAEKEFGLIVDYVGVLVDLDIAFRDFAGRSFDAADRPIEDKSKVVARLELEMAALRGLLEERDVSLEEIAVGTSERRSGALNRATERLVFPEVVRGRFLAATRVIVRLHRAIGLDARSAKFDTAVRTLQQIRGAIRAATEDEREIADRVLARVGPILDRAITAEPQPLPLGVSRINLVDRARALAATIDDPADETSGARVDAELLTVTATQAASEAARKDPALVPLQAKLEDLVRRYNEGALTPKSFAEAVETEVLRKIDARDIVASEEGLTRSELVAFDIVMEQYGHKLRGERDLVKDCVRQLGARLIDAMGIDWQFNEQGRSRVRVAIGDGLGALPSVIDDSEVDALTSEIYRFVLERGWDC